MPENHRICRFAIPVGTHVFVKDGRPRFSGEIDYFSGEQVGSHAEQPSLSSDGLERTEVSRVLYQTDDDSYRVREHVVVHRRSKAGTRWSKDEAVTRLLPEGGQENGAPKGKKGGGKKTDADPPSGNGAGEGEANTSGDGGASAAHERFEPHKMGVRSGQPTFTEAEARKGFPKLFPEDAEEGNGKKKSPWGQPNPNNKV